MNYMRKTIPFVLISALFLFLGVTMGIAQGTQTPTGAPAKAQKAKKVKKAKKAAETEEAEKAEKAKAPAAKAGPRALGKAETLSGTISIVNEKENLVIVTGVNGVPYSFRVTRGTRIKIAEKHAKFAELSGQVNKHASVEFIPRSDGNLARSIEVSG